MNGTRFLAGFSLSGKQFWDCNNGFGFPRRFLSIVKTTTRGNYVLRVLFAILKIYLYFMIFNALFQGQNKLIVLLAEPLTSEDNVVITVDKNGHRIEVTNVTKRNPYTLQFKMPC